jgi:dihydroxy-acid dehydratase
LYVTPTPTPAPDTSSGPRQDGDTIIIDAKTRRMDIEGITDDELAARRAAWTAPPLKATSGTLYKYIKLVGSASEGCVTDA